MKKDVLRNFTKFTGKHLCQSLFFDKVASLRPAKTSVVTTLYFRRQFYDRVLTVFPYVLMLQQSRVFEVVFLTKI